MRLIHVLKSESASVASVLREFFQKVPKLEVSLKSAEGSQLEYPRAVKNIYGFLKSSDEGFEVRLLRLKGLKFSLDEESCADVLLEIPATAVEHAVVVVNNGMIIDPCRLRLGKYYDLPSSYPKNELNKFWKEIRHYKLSLS